MSAPPKISYYYDKSIGQYGSVEASLLKPFILKCVLADGAPISESHTTLSHPPPAWLSLCLCSARARSPRAFLSRHFSLLLGVSYADAYLSLLLLLLLLLLQ